MAKALLRWSLFSIFLIFTLLRADSSKLESVPDLEKAMYLDVEAYPCVRLLNLSGEIGCSNPGHEKVIAPIIRLKDAREKLSYPSTVLVPSEEMKSFFLRVSTDPQFAKNIAGVLVESAEAHNMLPGFSPDKKFPQSEFASYQNHSYEWNPVGSGIMWNRYDFPVFLLSKESSAMVQEIVTKNKKKYDSYPQNVAEFDLAMQTTNAGTHDSESCLKERSCLPLGGYSVWSSLPPINVSSTKPTKPILLAITSQDSAAYFRDKSLGANSPISGLIAILAAVDALSSIHGLDDLKKQIVFAVFTGEAWGYLGSRRFLLELDSGANALNGLKSSMIEQVLEIGSVGKAMGQGVTTFYAHTENDSTATEELISAFQTASDSLGSDNVKVKKADASNPGVPPSSLVSFITKNSSISGVVLEDFDTSFSNNFYHSYLDDSSNINSSSIAAAAVLVARTIYVLANDHSSLDLFALNSIKINISMIEELVQCLLSCDPNVPCSIIRNYISPSSRCPNHYVGVFVDVPSDTQYPLSADDTSRFIWNFMAEKTAIWRKDLTSCNGKCNNSGEVCVGTETGNEGRCVVSTTRYVPSYSTRLKFEGDSWNVLPVNTSDPLGAADPVWTESYWNTIGLRIYKVQSSTYDRLVLITGVLLTVSTYFIAIAIKDYLTRVMKRD